MQSLHFAELTRHFGEHRETRSLNSTLAECLELSIPPEIVTTFDSIVPAMIREINLYGPWLLHRSGISAGEATVKMTSDTRESRYRVAIEKCRPVDNGMFMSGGRFLGKVEDDE